MAMFLMKTRVALRVTACPCDVRFTPKADICSALGAFRLPRRDAIRLSPTSRCS
jgi:hypothetical protein